MVHFLQGEEIVVHKAVDQGIAEEIGPSLPDAAVRRAEAFVDRGKNVVLRFEERDDEVFSKDKADLFIFGLLFFIVVGQHLDDDVDRLFVVVELGALSAAGDVFKQKRVEPEVAADHFDRLGVVDAADIDPGDAGRFHVGEAFLDGSLLQFDELFSVVVKQRQLHPARLLAVRRQQRARGKTRSFHS